MKTIQNVFSLINQLIFKIINFQTSPWLIFKCFEDDIVTYQKRNLHCEFLMFSLYLKKKLLFDIQNCLLIKTLIILRRKASLKIKASERRRHEFISPVVGESSVWSACRDRLKARASVVLLFAATFILAVTPKFYKCFINTTE